jgi:Rrf2 family cysteine metabolism transcriptional repressor
MIGFTTKGRYATRVLVYLALRREEGPAKKQAIAEAEDISPDYLEQILIRLKAAGIVNSHRGKSGGFSLAADPHKLPVSQVLEVMEGRMSVVPCLIGGACERSATCSTRSLWDRADRALKKVLSATTIGDLADQAPGAPDFHI